ncbi:MAG: large subunit ribosomal protein L1 [Candidatus Saccharimonadales bacterium]|jgi:large subunit ribosomal protein L1
MAKKADLLAEAKKLKLEVTEKNTIKEIEAALAAVDAPEVTAEPAEEKASTAKAGKRSAKGIAEAEEKAAKEERKEHASEENSDEEEAAKPKIIEIRKPRIERAGKKFQAASKLVDKALEYSTKDAIDLAIKSSTTKFDSTVELHIRLNVDPKQADQNVREILVLPAGNGKTVRVAVFGEADDVAAAKKAGADVAGAEEFLQQLDKGIIDFDVLIASPLVMAKLGKYARILGPKGLMPNPKSGTVTKDVVKAIEQARAGKVELRVDEAGIVHLGVGKVGFGTDKLLQNVHAVFNSIKTAKPSSVKGNYVETVYMTTTMGPSIRILNSEI